MASQSTWPTQRGHCAGKTPETTVKGTHPLAAIFFARRALPPISEWPCAIELVLLTKADWFGWWSGWTFSTLTVGALVLLMVVWMCLQVTVYGCARLE